MITVDITAGGNDAQGARVLETIRASVVVQPMSTTAKFVNFWTGGSTLGMSEEDSAIMLLASRFSLWSIYIGWLEVGDPATGYTFKAIKVDPTVKTTLKLI